MGDYSPDPYLQWLLARQRAAPGAAPPSLLNAVQMEDLGRSYSDRDTSQVLPWHEDHSAANFPSRSVNNFMGRFPAEIPPGLVHPMETLRTVQDDALLSIAEIPEQTRNAMARDQIGPWVTSHVSPYSYDPISHGLEMMGFNKSRSDIGPDFRNGATTALRDELWRKYWNMPPTNPNLWRASGTNMSLNPENPVSRQAIAEYQQGGVQRAPGRPFHPGMSSVSGHYVPGYPDPWNFDLHQNERPSPGSPYGPVSFVRQMMENFTGQNTPVVNTVYPR